MKRVTLSKQNSTPNFIGAWVIDPISICDDLITCFELNQDKHIQGAVAGGVDLTIKKSIDFTVSPKNINLHGNEAFEEYFHSLFDCYEDYLTQWPFLKEFASDLEIGRFNIQRYQRGEHFAKIHTERSSTNTLHRLFAWMTYLDDVDVNAGGATYFSHYDIEVQPKKGLTLIWPAEWTHAHKGNILNAGSKHIITGWMNFYK